MIDTIFIAPVKLCRGEFFMALFSLYPTCIA